MSLQYEFLVYPTSEFESDTRDRFPIVLAIVASAVFFTIAIFFFVYDSFVSKRNRKIVDAAAKSNAVILSLFPASIRDKLLAQQEWKLKCPKNRSMVRLFEQELEDIESIDGDPGSIDSKPIAELFPDSTVFFGTCQTVF